MFLSFLYNGVPRCTDQTFGRQGFPPVLENPLSGTGDAFTQLWAKDHKLVPVILRSPKWGSAMSSRVHLFVEATKAAILRSPELASVNPD